MAKVICALVYLYCSSGCRAEKVASKLTFHPPTPYYDFETIEDEGGGDGQRTDGRELRKDKIAKEKYKLLLNPDLPAIPREVSRCYSCHMILTSTGTFVPLMCFTHKDAHFTIVVSHGNASDIGAMFIFYAMLNLRLKVNVVGYDYTGYGASLKYGDNPSESQTYLDVEAVYDWVCEYNDGELIPSGIPRNHIVVYGQSVGSGPSCYLASGKSVRPIVRTSKSKQNCLEDSKTGVETAPVVDSSCFNCCVGATEQRDVAGLVLHSPIMSGVRVLTANRCLACFDIYPNLDFIKSVSAPVFIIHGEADQEVSVSHGLGLHERVPETHKTPPWWVRDRGHNDVLKDNEEEFFRRMMAYLLLVRTRQNKARQEQRKGEEQSESNLVTQVGDADVAGDAGDAMWGQEDAAGVPLVAVREPDKDYKAIATSAIANA